MSSEVGEPRRAASQCTDTFWRGHVHQNAIRQPASRSVNHLSLPALVLSVFLFSYPLQDKVVKTLLAAPRTNFIGGKRRSVVDVYGSRMQSREVCSRFHRTTLSSTTLKFFTFCRPFCQSGGGCFYSILFYSIPFSIALVKLVVTNNLPKLSLN